MKKYWPIVAALVVVGAALGWVASLPQTPASPTRAETAAVTNRGIGSFAAQKRCGRPPRFLRKLHIPQPVMIDLSQKRYTGIALLFGPEFSKALHPKQWEQYEHFSTYAVDEAGHIYLVPTPFISIRPTTFTLQQKLYRLDTDTGRVEIWMEFDDVRPSERNPYGINAIAYDCRDKTLWVGAIDESDYTHQRGVIYHIDPRTKTILSRYEGFDALTLMRIETDEGAFLLAGSARDNVLYAFRLDGGRLQPPQALLEIPNATERIRKIKVRGPNRLELQTIPFSYSLIAQTAEHDRTHYEAVWSPDRNRWSVRKIEPK
jgi:hypothetical protein